MGLFDRFKKQEEKPLRLDESYQLRVNLTEKSIKADFKEDTKTFTGDLQLVDGDKFVTMMHGRSVLFEVSNRSKAYREVKAFVPYKVHSVTLMKRQGDYGYYYTVKIFFEMSPTEAHKVAIEAITGGKK